MWDMKKLKEQERRNKGAYGKYAASCARKEITPASYEMWATAKVALAWEKAFDSLPGETIDLGHTKIKQLQLRQKGKNCSSVTGSTGRDGSATSLIVI